MMHWCYDSVRAEQTSRSSDWNSEFRNLFATSKKKKNEAPDTWTRRRQQVEYRDLNGGSNLNY